LSVLCNFVGCTLIAFGALTLLVGHEKEHRACEN